MNKEHPILFSTPMVKALLEGKKTMTRRVINPQPKLSTSESLVFENGILKRIYRGEAMIWQEKKEGKSRYNVGDILWVRETFGTVMTKEMNILDHYDYRADEKKRELSFALKHSKWKPSIFMPHEAARLFLEVKSVRIERLQDISEEDAKAEGIDIHECEMPDSYRDDSNKEHCTFYVCSACEHQTLRGGYSKLWDSLNAKRGYSWESNPWVWVYEFIRIEK